MIAQLIRFGLQFSWSRFCCAAILDVLIAPITIPIRSCLYWYLAVLFCFLWFCCFCFSLIFFLLIISTFMALLIAISELCIGVQITRTLYRLICRGKSILERRHTRRLELTTNYSNVDKVSGNWLNVRLCVVQFVLYFCILFELMRANCSFKIIKNVNELDSSFFAIHILIRLANWRSIYIDLYICIFCNITSFLTA